MGELCPDNRSSHFDMINDCHFESNNDFPFEMTGFKKYDCRFEMIYDCRFEMTGAKIFVNKKLRYSKHWNQYFGTENSPYILLYENLI